MYYRQAVSRFIFCSMVYFAEYIMNLIEGLAVFLFLLCHPTGNDSLGAICAGDSGLTQCDVPILTPAQVISIDRGRVEAMREKMMNTTGVRRPIYASDGDPALTMPLINFTDAQLSMVRRLYRYVYISYIHW